MSTPLSCLYLVLGVNNRMSTHLSYLYLALGVNNMMSTPLSFLYFALVVRYRMSTPLSCLYLAPGHYLWLMKLKRGIYTLVFNIGLKFLVYESR